MISMCAYHCAIVNNFDMERISWANFYSPYLHVNTYMAAYASIVIPITLEGEWNQSSLKVMPPIRSRVARRPRKMRVTDDEEEPKEVEHCTLFGEQGHRRGYQGVQPILREGKGQEKKQVM